MSNGSRSSWSVVHPLARLCDAVILLLGLPASAFAQSSILKGRVVSAIDERPVAGAYVEFLALGLRTRTDSTGAFRMELQSSGQNQLQVRALGYDSLVALLTFVPGDSIDAEFLLATSGALLAPVRVSAATDGINSLRLGEFDERKKSGLGRFVDGSIFEVNRDRQLAVVLLERVPGLRTRRRGAKMVLETQRDGRSCFPQIIVNGLSMFNGGGEAFEIDINSFLTSDVLGMEFYTPSNTPAKYNGSALGPRDGASCGTVVLWTK